MIIGKAVGTVVTTISHPHYDKRRLLVVQPLVGVGDEDERAFIAVDHAHAGVGDTVLVNRDGNGARDVLNLEGGCIISVIVGIVDSVNISK